MYHVCKSLCYTYSKIHKIIQRYSKSTSLTLHVNKHTKERYWSSYSDSTRQLLPEVWGAFCVCRNRVTVPKWDDLDYC